MTRKTCSLFAAALVAAASSCLFADGDSPASPTVIYETAATGESGAVNGTKMGLAVNLPNASWSAGGGWEWAEPTMGSDGVYSLTEEKACLYLPLDSAGSYVRPSTFTVSGAICYPGNGGNIANPIGIGFWSAAVPQSRSDYVNEETGEPEIRRYYSLDGFYGLAYYPQAHAVRVFVNGSGVGDTIPLPACDETYHEFSFTINNTDGSISEIMHNGQYVIGLAESDQFTAANTHYVGMASFGGARCLCSRLTVSEGIVRAEVPVFAQSEDFVGVAYVGQATALDVSAVGSSSGTAATVTVAPFGDSGAYSIANGTFTWTPAVAGTYEMTFTATIGEETAVRHATYTVYAARATIDANTWTNEGDNAFTPAAANLLLGVTGTETRADAVSFWETQGPIDSLTDGEVTAYNTVNGRYLVRNNSVIEWDFGKTAPISEIRIYSAWGNSDRNDISVRSMEYRGVDGNWVQLPVDAFNYSRDGSKNNVGAADGFLSRRRVFITMPNGGNMVEAASGLRINFAGQDNDYGGYLEIEAIAPLAFASAWACEKTSATATVQVSDVWKSLDATVTFAYAPHGEAMSAASALSLTDGAAEVNLLALTSDRVYDYVFTASAQGRDPVTLSGSFRTKIEKEFSVDGLMQTTLSGDNNLTNGADYANAVLVAGPVMGFKTSGWGQNTTYLYTGFIYLEEGVTYGFGTKIDDRANITINGTEVVRSANYAYASGTYTPPYTGWHTVDIRVGNGTGGAGPIGEFVGLAYNAEGATAENYGAWKALTDNGDGTLFATTLDGSPLGMIDILSLLGKSGSATLSVETKLSQAADIYVCAGATYGGTNATAWGSKALLGSVQGSGVESLIGTVAIANGAALIRVIAYAKDADPATSDPIAASKTWALAEFPSTSGEPVLANPHAVSATATSADIAATILFAGSGDTAEVSISYGPAAESLIYSATLSSAAAVGEFEETLQGLLPNRLYYARLTMKGADNAESQSDVFTFSTDDLSETVAPAVAEAPAMPLPGVMQGRYTCVKNSPADISVRIADLAAADTDRTLGFLMARASADAGSADSAKDQSDSVTSASWKWANNTTYYYEGAIYLEGGTTLYVASKFDDGTAVYINDVEVFHEVTMAGDGSGYDHAGNYNVGAFTPEKSGWYPIRGYVWDWEGGKNRMYGIAAIQWTTDAAAIDLTGDKPVAVSSSIDNTAYWHEFYDDGAGLFLRTAEPVRALEVSSYGTTGGSLAATLAYGEFQWNTPLYVAYGSTYGGDDTNAWEHVVKVSDAGTASGTVQHGPLAGLGDAVRYVRYFFDLSVIGGDPCFTPTLYFVDMNAPSLSSATSVSGVEQGDGAVVSGELLSPGATGSCTVTLETSRTGDFSDAFTREVGVFTAGAALVCDLTTNDTTSAGYIVPGTTTWYRFKAVDANNLPDYSATGSFTTPAGAVIANPSAAASSWNASYSVDIKDVGAGGSATVELWTGLSYSTLALAGTATATKAGKVTIPVSHDAFMRYGYRFRVTNACATESWETWTDIAYVDVLDNASYTWKAGVTSGNWEDAANWVSSVDDPRCAYPNSTQSDVSFANCEAGVPVTVSLGSAVSVKTLALSTEGIGVKIAGVGSATSRLMIGAGDGTPVALPANATLTLSGLYARFHDYSNKSGSKLRLENGAEVLSHTECVLGAGSNALEVVVGSSFQINNYLLRLGGQSPRLLIDDATVNIKGNFSPSNNRNERDSVTTFAGRAPRLLAGNITPSEADNTPGDMAVFRFNVPADGYAEGAVITPGGTFPNGTKQAIRMEVERNSAWFSGSRTASFKLVSAAKGIQTDYVDFADQPRADRTHFYYTYGANDSTESDGNAPTGLWVTLDGRAPMAITIR